MTKILIKIRKRAESKKVDDDVDDFNYDWE